MYRYCQRWESEQGREIGLTLQVGDIGIVNEARLDKATRRHAETDPAELGAVKYINGSRKPSHLTVFVRGNHDDSEFFSRLPRGGFIDPHRFLYYLSPLQVFQLSLNSKEIIIAGLGGIAPDSDDDREKTLARQRYFDNWKCDALLSLPSESVDILLTHDGPAVQGLRRRGSAGALEINWIIEHLKPRFAFFGHYSDPPVPFFIGKTLCVGMNSKQALKLPKRDGAMGIVDPATLQFEFVQSWKT